MTADMMALTHHPSFIGEVADDCALLILCVGMRRARSTWQHQVAADVLGVPAFDAGVQPPNELARKPNGIYVIKTHIGFPAYESLLERDNVRALYSYRDVRDVLYSWMFRVKIDFQGGLSAVREVLVDDDFWRRQKNVLVQRYEEIAQAPDVAIQQIAAHVGRPVSLTEASEIALRHTLETMRRTKEGHVRTGRIGSWSDSATLEERRQMRAVMQPWLLANGYVTDDRWAREDPPSAAVGFPGMATGAGAP